MEKFQATKKVTCSREIDETGTVAALPLDPLRTALHGQYLRQTTPPSDIYPHLFQDGRNTHYSSESDKSQGNSIRRRKAD